MTKTTLTYIIISLFLSLIAYCLVCDDGYFKFTNGVTEISALIMPYGMIALLIERFVNIILLPQDNRNLKQSIRVRGLNHSETLTLDQKHTKEFVKLSLAIGILVSAIGFRFFTQIVDVQSCDYLLNSDIKYKELFNVVDVFFTGLLLSGGGQLINRIVQFFTPNPNT